MHNEALTASRLTVMVQPALQSALALSKASYCTGRPQPSNRNSCGNTPVDTDTVAPFQTNWLASLEEGLTLAELLQALLVAGAAPVLEITNTGQGFLSLRHPAYCVFAVGAAAR